MYCGRSGVCCAAIAAPVTVWTLAGMRSRGSREPWSGVVAVTTVS